MSYTPLAPGMTARVRRDAIRDRVRDRRRRVAVLAGLHELLAGGGAVHRVQAAGASAPGAGTTRLRARAAAPAAVAIIS